MAKRKQRESDSRRMKIQGWIGNRDGGISTLCVAIQPKREYVAIERFKKGTTEGTPDFIYIETPFNPKQTKGIDRLSAYLERERRYIGSYSTSERYHAGLRHTGNTTNKSQRSTGRDLHEYTSEIAGDMYHKMKRDLSQIEKNRKRAEDSEREFIKSIVRNTPSKLLFLLIFYSLFFCF